MTTSYKFGGLLIFSLCCFTATWTMAEKAKTRPHQESKSSVKITINGKEIDIPANDTKATSITFDSKIGMIEPHPLDSDIQQIIENMQKHHAIIIPEMDRPFTTGSFTFKIDGGSSNTHGLVIEIDKMIDQFNQQPHAYKSISPPIINFRGPNQNRDELHKQLEQFRIEMDQLGRGNSIQPLPPGNNRNWTFSYNIAAGLQLKDEGDYYKLSMDAQSLDVSAFKIEIKNQNLIVTITKEDIIENIDSKGRKFRSRSQSTSTNSINLPQDINASGIKRKVENDRLIITIPKKGKSIKPDLKPKKKQEWL